MANTLRRLYLGKRILSRERGELALSALWQGKQEAEPGGAPLPEEFPFRGTLVAVGYAATGDLEGADEDELTTYAGLSRRQAREVLAAFAAL